MCSRGGFPGGPSVKNPPPNARDEGDVGSVPGWGRSPGGGHGNPLQYSCLENPMDRGAWQAIVHRHHRKSDMTEATWHTGTLVENYAVARVSLAFMPELVLGLGEHHFTLWPANSLSFK